MKGILGLVKRKQNIKASSLETHDKKQHLIDQNKHLRFTKQNNIISLVKRYILTLKVIWYYPIAKRV